MRRWIGTPWASVTIPEKCATLFPRNEVVGESYRAASNNRHHNTSNYNSNNPQQRPTTLHLSFISIHFFFFQIHFSNLFLLLHIFSDGNLTGFAMTGNSVAATVSQPKGFKHPLNIFIFVFFFLNTNEWLFVGDFVFVVLQLGFCLSGRNSATPQVAFAIPAVDLFSNLITFLFASDFCFLSSIVRLWR